MYKKFLSFFYKTNKTAKESKLLSHDRQNKHLIELCQIEKIYHTDAGDFTALRGVDLQVNAGEFLAIIGKSGSGKSTILNMITGVDRPTSGEVMINGTAVHAMKENQLAVWRGRNIGIVFQFFQLLPTLSVLENIMLPMDFCNMYRPIERQERAMSLLEMVEMTAKANKLPTELSGGQQQRVAIVRALANDPPIIVADEPTGNLDSKTADAIFNLFDELVSRGKTILMVTHDSDIQRRVRRTITVADGEIVHQTAGGSPL
ncbi:putative ABC transport system ATP-binding protein [Sporomusaceae bacterium BoRhaA]|uniref:ABC transporter ATP-binding protein n=1 Tax=Pelorhabdus rhamnosifermentans TaxID=2772457 RepID=UPI001C0623F6|nr:ABC transporter ATP-binding protein [Pelorhabdus rhamnosifermentans]MBU2703470.1 putative ABC transport system ATP-binding protein [Pelorhabdus rhamnosifermentans]